MKSQKANKENFYKRVNSLFEVPGIERLTGGK
jgi:hypothetical protein